MNPLQEKLNEIEKKFGEQFCVMLERSLYTDEEIEEVYTFLRQSNIETVKWVMEMIEDKRRKLVTQPARYKGSDANVWREGKNTAIDEIKMELNKSIE